LSADRQAFLNYVQNTSSVRCAVVYNTGEKPMRKYTIYLYIFLTSFLFLLRAIFFAGSYGAVEHDSGWFMGVARNLAQRGIYASYTNTIRKEGIGAYPSLHGRYSVQDSEGYSYFPAGVTAGPGYVVPQAIFFKLFGFGFWQLRAWPLLAFLGMLIFLFYLTYLLGGIVSVVILQVWLWVVPQLYITFAYEGFGEHIALFYLLASLYFLWTSLTVKRKGRTFFVLGVLFSLSILTKYLTLLAGGAFILVFVYDFYKNRGELKKTLIYWFYLTFGILFPIGLFEAYRYLVLTSLFDKSAWDAINADFLLHFKANGSGVSLYGIDWEFVSRKLTVWKKVGITYFLLPWILLIISPLLLYQKKLKEKRGLFLLIFTSSLSIFFWYLFASPTGWTRHVLLGLILSMVLISVSLGTLFNLKKKVGYLAKGGVIILLSLTFVTSSGFYPNLFLDRSDIESWRVKRYEGGIQGLPHTDTFSLSDQTQLINFFEENIKDSDRVYYLGWFLLAEASPLVDRVFYSLDRYLEIGQAKGPEGGQSFLIIGPYQKGKFSLMPRDYHDKKIKELCREVVFINSSYTLCTLKTSLVYENKAYD